MSIKEHFTVKLGAPGLGLNVGLNYHFYLIDFQTKTAALNSPTMDSATLMRQVLHKMRDIYATLGISITASIIAWWLIAKQMP